jgi:hypothetical protein
MAAKVFSDLLMHFRAVGFPALHLYDQLIDRFFQGSHTVVKLVKEEADKRDGDDLYDIEDILENKVK